MTQKKYQVCTKEGNDVEILTTKTNLIMGVFNTEEEAAKSPINPSSDEVITSFEYEVDCD